MRNATTAFPTPLAEPTIWIVDDEAEVRQSLTCLVESVNLAAQPFADAQAFFEHFDAAQAGCVIVDLRLPLMNGLDVARRLIAQGATTPVILISGHSDIAAVTQAFKIGCCDFIEKPFSMHRVLESLQSAVMTDLQSQQKRVRRRAAHTRLMRLTPGERQVVSLIMKGLSNKDIASQLNLTIKAIEARRARIRERLDVNSLIDLIDLVHLAEFGCEHGVPEILSQHRPAQDGSALPIAA